MAHLTGNFTSESPLSERVRQAISAALEQGWADPKKLSQASHRSLALRQGALAEIAEVLAISPADLEVIGEPALIHHIAIGGFLGQKSPFITSAVDVGKIRAVARAHMGPSQILSVNPSGAIELPTAPLAQDSLISLQAGNGETGVLQELEPWRDLSARIVLDATRSIPKPNICQGFSAATFDATSWGGPQGIGLIFIGDRERFRYPLAHIAPIRVPGSFSIPLLVGSAIALTEMKDHELKIFALRELLLQSVQKIDGLSIAGTTANSDSRYLTVLIDGLSGEEVLRNLMQSDIHVDSGSACSPEDLAPSHVLAAMGHPGAGSLRFTLSPWHTSEDIARAVAVLQMTLEKLRH